jgi:small subunit ribosomal protein S6
MQDEPGHPALFAEPSRFCYTLLCSGILGTERIHSLLQLKLGPNYDRREVITTKRTYEALYIVDATLADDQVQAIADKFAGLTTEHGGEVQAAGKWDRRRLAYEVAGRREGTYILMYFAGEAAIPKELDSVLRISDDVLRHIIIRVEPEHIDLSLLARPEAEKPVQTPTVDEPTAEDQAEGQADAEPAADTATPAEIIEPVAESETAVAVES